MSQARNDFEKWVIDRYYRGADATMRNHLFQLGQDGDYEHRDVRIARDAWNAGRENLAAEYETAAEGDKPDPSHVHTFTV